MSGHVMRISEEDEEDEEEDEADIAGLLARTRDDVSIGSHVEIKVQIDLGVKILQPINEPAFPNYPRL